MAVSGSARQRSPISLRVASGAAGVALGLALAVPASAIAQSAGDAGSTGAAAETAPLPRSRPVQGRPVLLPNGSRAPAARQQATPGEQIDLGSEDDGIARDDLAPPAGIESSELAPPSDPSAAETAPETDENGEAIIEDPAAAALAEAEGDLAAAADADASADDGRFKAAPFRTPEFPEVDRSITIGAAAEADSARVAILDMVTATTETVELRAGSPTGFHRLTLTLVACARPEQRGGIGDIGLIEIADARVEDGAVFSGWMFAESPALSALDHPRYDVWLISCIARSPETTGGNASNEAERDSASANSAR
ncbi:MAG: DUF2155 domain-containing protein [Pseudomonadota bacterium]